MSRDEWIKLFSPTEGRMGVIINTELPVPKALRFSYKRCRHCAAKCLIWLVRTWSKGKSHCLPADIGVDSDEEGDWDDISEKSYTELCIREKAISDERRLFYPVSAAEWQALAKIREINNTGKTDSQEDATATENGDCVSSASNSKA